ncbi:MAG: ABC transporter permease [Deltaproteobacteria bacterium]|nr:ABC transporter permease [Deltaproteobacteria bacterium]
MRATLFIAGRQLWHRKLLNGIAVLGVMLGVLTLIAITGIMRGFQTKFLDTILQISPHVVVFDKTLGDTTPIVDQLLGGPSATAIVRQTSTDRQQRIARPTETVRAMRALEGVAAVAPLVVGSAVASAGSKETPVELRGIDPEVQDVVTPLRSMVVDGQLGGLTGAVDGAMIGHQLADLLGVKVGDNLSCASALGDRVVLRVVAIFETGVAALDKGRIYVATRRAQTILGRGDAIDRIELRLVDPDHAPAVTAQLEALFHYDAESWQETNASMLGVFDQQNMITGLIIGAVLLVGGFGILSIQIMIVLEKRRDIALLKSVGYGSRDVLAIFLTEGAVIAVLGAALGAAAGHFVLAGMRLLKSASGMGYSKPSTFAIYERPIVYVLAFGFAVGVGLLASLVPAWRASRVEPVDVLRGT